MERIEINGRIEYCSEEDKEYNGSFTAILSDSAAFDYGNKTEVRIFFGITSGGSVPVPIYIDTRYDLTIKRNETDFKKWVQKYFEENYSKHILVIY